MRFRTLSIAGLIEVDIDPFTDTRGSFARVWCTDEFSRAGIEADFVQANVARTTRRGVIRGLHFQLRPAAEAKLIRCTAGSIFDVAVDVRPDSATYGSWSGSVLDSSSGKMLLVPPGCAHGYQALQDNSDVHYMVSCRYTPDLERGIRWDDPDIGIEWPVTDRIMVSDKDAALPPLRELSLN